MKFIVPKKTILNPAGQELDTTVVKINRCATVVKGGRRFSFSAMVVVGNRHGVVGYGFGKANEVPPSVEKAEKDARKNLYEVNLDGSTIPHQIEGRFGASRVLLLPASPGTGVIAGAAVRAVVELAGIKNILTKSLGSSNSVNLVKATIQGLVNLRRKQDIEGLRGVDLHDAISKADTVTAATAEAPAETTAADAN